MAFYSLVLAVLMTVAAAGGVCAQVPAPSQPDGAQAEPANDAFYSGNVSDLAADHVTVVRTILNKRPEKRTFQIKENTKIEGKLKQKSRVTVRYVPGEDGDVAVSILVRPVKKPK